MLTCEMEITCSLSGFFNVFCSFKNFLFICSGPRRSRGAVNYRKVAGSGSGSEEDYYPTKKAQAGWSNLTNFPYLIKKSYEKMQKSGSCSSKLFLCLYGYFALY